MRSRASFSHNHFYFPIISSFSIECCWFVVVYCAACSVFCLWCSASYCYKIIRNFRERQNLALFLKNFKFWNNFILFLFECYFVIITVDFKVIQSTGNLIAEIEWNMPGHNCLSLSQFFWISFIFTYCWFLRFRVIINQHFIISIIQWSSSASTTICSTDIIPFTRSL